jgi:hypothetical protein
MDGLVQLWYSVLTRNVTWVMGQIIVIDWNLRINSLKLHNWWNRYVARLCQIIHKLCFTISFWNQYIYCQPKLLEWIWPITQVTFLVSTEYHNCTRPSIEIPTNFGSNCM